MEKLALHGGSPVREKPFPAWPKAGAEEREWVEKVLTGTRWFAGPRGDDPKSLSMLFASRFAQMHGADFAHLVSNGSVSLEIALRALGIGQGDEVIVPAYTFVSTATSVLMVGAIPIFADIDPHSYCLDPEDVARKVSTRTKALIPVHLGGQMADMPALCELAAKHGLFIVEDCAQAIDAALQNRKAGTWGELGSFSFQANKTITSGEGGLVMTSDPKLAELVRAYCAFGRLAGGDAERSSAFRSHFLSSNYRLSELQAAVLLGQLDRFAGQDKLRRQNAAHLTEGLHAIPGLRHVCQVSPGGKHGYYYYLLRFDPQHFGGATPQELCEALVAEGIPFIPGDAHPLYHNPVFSPDNLSGSLCPEVLKSYLGRIDLSQMGCPQTEQACRRTLILRHQVLLGTRLDMGDIIAAMDKVQRLLRTN